MNRRGRLAAWGLLVGLLIATAYGSRASAGKPAPDVLYRYSTAVGGAIEYAVMLGFVLWIASGERSLLALRRPDSWPRALGLGLAVLVGVLIVNAILNPLLNAGQEQGLTPHGWDSHHAAQFAANFAVVTLVAPLVEELTYRGLGYSLLATWGQWLAIPATAVLFGLSHGLVEALPILAAFGFGLAWLRSRTDSAYPGMVVHGAFNALALVLAVTT